MFGSKPKKVDPLTAIEEARKIIVDQHSDLTAREQANTVWHKHFVLLKRKDEIARVAIDYADAFVDYALLHDDNHPDSWPPYNDKWDERRRKIVIPVADFFTKQIGQAVEILRTRRIAGNSCCCPNYFCNYFFLLNSKNEKISALRMAFYRFVALRAPMIFHWHASDLVRKMLEECDSDIRERLQQLVDEGEAERQRP